jgi:alkylhydroperoxidase family enzyme
MFLQAAGMPHAKVRALAEGLRCDTLAPQQEILAAFAAKVSSAPVAFEYDDCEPARRTLNDDGLFVEAALVVSGFNFANRCADALGVRPEVPRFLNRWPAARWAVMRLLSCAIRVLTDFENRPVKAACADEVLRDLRTGMARAGMGELPPFFERLRCRPDLLAVQATATRAALLENALSRALNLRLAYVVSAVNNDAFWTESVARELRASGLALEPADPRERSLLRFAHAIALAPDRITKRDLDELRRHGVSDEVILDVVAVCAAVAAGNRLNRMLVPAAVLCHASTGSA